jgi:hypothetical protein
MGSGRSNRRTEKGVKILALQRDTQRALFGVANAAENGFCLNPFKMKTRRRLEVIKG